jgi:hypothetical protein
MDAVRDTLDFTWIKDIQFVIRFRSELCVRMSASVTSAPKLRFRRNVSPHRGRPKSSRFARLRLIQGDDSKWELGRDFVRLAHSGINGKELKKSLDM